MAGGAGLVVSMTVSVAWSPAPGEAHEVTLTVPDGATVLDALRRAGVVDNDSNDDDLDPTRRPVGVWGRRCGLDRVLRDRDRVEVYRPLTADPMEARRRRQREQSAPARPRRPEPTRR